MCALIVICCYDTPENGRAEYTERTLDSLAGTVDFRKHRLLIVDNGSTDPKTGNLLYRLWQEMLISLPTNLGTARGINEGIRRRAKGEHVIKIDNDVVINHNGWADELQWVADHATEYGIIGLKRKDLRQTPYDEDQNFRSELRQLPHHLGEPWVIVEESADIMGTCTLFSSALLDKIGGMFQGDGTVYGFDDTLMSLRSRLAGFKNCFLPHINIDHIDTGEGEYTQEKQRLAAEAWPKYHILHEEFISGKRSLYVEP